MYKIDFKKIASKCAPHFLAIVAMAIVASVYFAPAWEDKQLMGEDHTMSAGKFREIFDFQTYEGQDDIIWNGVMFGGMPEYISAHYKGARPLVLLWLVPVRQLSIPLEVYMMFWYMFGFYILLMTFKVSPTLGALFSIAFALTSYNLIIIMAGHYSKVQTILFIPPTIAGILLCFKRKYALGFILTTVFLIMQIQMKHVQMTYYSMLLLSCVGIVNVIKLVKEKDFKSLYRIVGVLCLAGVMACSVSFSKLANIYKYSQESTRGKSELSLSSNSTKTSSGLDKDYINAWSSGVTESLMVVVPNVHGGKTGQVSNNKELYGKIPAKERKMLGNSNQYWGNQTFSGGPSYLGSVLMFLFFISLFLVEGTLKKGLLAGAILLTMLSWGGNFSVFTDLFIDYLPFYNKFRAPVSILAIVGVATTFLAALVLSDIVKRPEILHSKKKMRFFKKPQNPFLIASALFLLFLVLNLLFPNLLNFYISDQESSQFAAMLSKQPQASGQINAYINSLQDFRISVFRTEVARSLFFSALTFVLILLFSKKKLKANVLVILIGLLAIVDLYSVANRYVNSDSFGGSDAIDKMYTLSTADEKIYALEMRSNPQIESDFKDYTERFKPVNDSEEKSILRHVVTKNSHYRVFNLTQSPFNETNTSNAHHSIGGYHAAKLRRYQDMIEHHISKNNMDVLNMLDTKYFITKKGVQVNKGALGAAWFVNTAVVKETPNEEILALKNFDPSHEVVVSSSAQLKSFAVPSVNDYIKLDSYSPEKLQYSTNCSENLFAVFSEIYYPDWKLYADGKPVEIIQVNYILRGAIIPKGTKSVEMVFEPTFFKKTNLFSQIAFFILLIVLFIVAFNHLLYRFKGKRMF